MVIYLERGADLHLAQLMPLPLTVFCFSKIQIGFTFLVPAHPRSPGQRTVKRVLLLLLLGLSVEWFAMCCSDQLFPGPHEGDRVSADGRSDLHRRPARRPHLPTAAHREVRLQ